MVTSRLHSPGSPTTKRGEKIRIGYLTPAFLGVQKRVEMLRHPCILGVPNAKRWEKVGSGYVTLAFSGLPDPNAGRKFELATSPLPSRGRKRGQKCYVTPAFSGVPKQGNEIRSGHPTPAFWLVSGERKWAETLRHPCILGGTQHQARGGNQKWVPNALFSLGPKEGSNAMSPLHSQGSPNKGTTSEVAISLLPFR